MPATQLRACSEGRCCSSCASSHAVGTGCNQCRVYLGEAGLWSEEETDRWDSEGWEYYDHDLDSDLDDDDDRDDDDDDAGSATRTHVVPEWALRPVAENDPDHQPLTVGEFNDRPTPIFHGRGSTYLGWELELEFPYSTYVNEGTRLEMSAAHAAERIASNLAPTGLLYLKYDGSLNNGIEFVTHPMTYQWAVKNFPWELIDRLRDGTGANAPRGAGLHVHVGRTAFTDTTHAYRWLRIMWRMQTQIDAIARRRSDEWAAWRTEVRNQVKRIAKGEPGERLDRYTAVNVNNRDTFEVRVFRSSTDPQQIQAALGLVDATVEYTRTLTIPEINQDGWQWEGFYRWVVAQGGLYGALIKESERLQICV